MRKFISSSPSSRPFCPPTDFLFFPPAKSNRSRFARKSYSGSSYLLVSVHERARGEKRPKKGLLPAAVKTMSVVQDSSYKGNSPTTMQKCSLSSSSGERCELSHFLTQESQFHLSNYSWYTVEKPLARRDFQMQQGKFFAGIWKLGCDSPEVLGNSLKVVPELMNYHS